MTREPDDRPVALYARVSSDRQDVDLSITGQFSVPRDFVQNDRC